MFNALSRWCGGVWNDARAKIDVDGGHGGEQHTGELVRHLGLISVIFFTITQAVGAGILTTPGLISAKYAGSWGFLSYLWAGLIVMPAAMCIAYNAAKSAKAGSTGSYASKYFGQLVGLLMFIDVMLECVGGTAAVAVSQGEHIKLVLDIWNEHSAVPIQQGFAWGSLFLMAVIGFFGAKLFTYGRGIFQNWKAQRAANVVFRRRLLCASWRLSVLLFSALPLFYSASFGADFLRRLPDWATSSPKNMDAAPLLIALIAGAAGSALVYLCSNLLPAWRKETRKGVALQVRMLHGGGRLFGLVAGASLLVVAIGSGYVFAASLPSLNLLSVGVIAVITAVLLRGIKETAWLTNAFTALKLCVLAWIIYKLGGHFNWANIDRPIPDNLPGTLAGASEAFFAYVGLDMATTSAGETKNPKRNVPLGMLVGAVCVLLLYVAASMALNGAVPYEQLGKTSAPFAKALVILGYESAAIWVAVAATLAMVSVVLASAYSTTRLLFNVAEHDMLPWFNKVNEKGVPVIATYTVGILIASLTALLDVDELMHLTNIGTMTAFITVSAIVFFSNLLGTNWRSREAFMASFWIVVALAGMIGPGVLMVTLIKVAPAAFYRLLIVWSGVIVLFVVYTRHRTRKRVEATLAAAAAEEQSGSSGEQSK